MKKLFEAKQKPLVVYNPADIFMKYNMRPGDYVSIAYVSDPLQGEGKHPIVSKAGSRKQCYNINAETDAELQRYINNMPNSKIKQLLTEFRESPKYQSFLNGTAKAKTCMLDLRTEHILKISHLICNWKDSKALAKFYKKQNDAEISLRREFGFEDGFDNNYERFYDREDDTPVPLDDRTSEEKENDKNWRDSYNGRNVMPRISQKGNEYNFATIIPGIYANLNKPGNIALRFAYNGRSSHKVSDYYYVNGDGSLFKLDMAFITFLKYAYKKNKESSSAEKTYVTDEEKEFVLRLSKLVKEAPSTAEKTLKTDSILFMKSTARTSKNAKISENIPFVWVNTKAVVSRYNFVNPTELNNIIKNLVYSLDDTDVNGTIENINIKGKSISDLLNIGMSGKATADPAAVRRRLGITEALHMLAYKFTRTKKKRALYESIMRNVSKTIKRKLQLI